MQQEHLKEPAPGLDTSIFLAVIAEGDAEQRCVLASQLAAFLGRPDTPQGEKEQLWPIVLKLAVDVDAEVRRMTAANERLVRHLPEVRHHHGM